MTDVKTDKKADTKAKAVNPYAMFMTEADLEVSGTDIDYGAFKVRIARAGGRNTMYGKVMTQILKPFKNVSLRDMEKEELDALYAEAYSRAIVKAWFVKDAAGAWVPGIVNAELEVVKADAKEIKAVLCAAPDLLADLMDQANELSTFQKEQEDEILGN